MINVTSFNAVAGTTVNVSLLLQNGTTEVLNDSNFPLFLNIGTGICMQLPGVAQLYPTPSQGGTLVVTINPTNLGQYMAADDGPANGITVNQYLPGEISGNAYPFMIVRSVAPQINPFQSIATGTAAALSSGLTLTANIIGSPATLYFEGFDLDIDQESTTHQVNVTVTGLGQGFGVNLTALTLHYLYRTQATGAIHDRVRF